MRQDILKEMFNITVGKAAEMLSEITGKKIILDIPDINIKNKIPEDYFEMLPEGALMISSISFQEKLKGKANLIFPAKKMRTFIDLCLNQEEESHEDIDFTDMDYDIIKEVGNIILNSIVGGLGNFLSINLDYTVPEVKLYNKRILKEWDGEDFLSILIIYIRFTIDGTEIDGAIILDLTLNSINELMNKIKIIEDGLNE